MQYVLTKVIAPIGLMVLFFISSCARNAQPGIDEVMNAEVRQTLVAPLVSPEENYVFMTYNIRLDAPDPGNRAWSVRRALVKDRIQTHGCDIIGVQEALGNQITDLQSDLPGFWRIGTGRDGNGSSEHSSIFYRTSKFNLLSSGTFWLSPGAPTTATGPSWDAAYRRICSWGKFQDKTTKLIFFVFNAHFDHKGVEARQNSAELILSYMQANIGPHPAIFMGDLNASQSSAPYLTLNNSDLLEESWNVAATKAPALRVTSNGWNINPTGNTQIDHIFVTGQWTVNSRLVDWYHQDPGDIVPSDHWPVIAKMYVNGVTFYQDAHYGGASGFVPVGSYTMSELSAFGMPNDWASSVRIPVGRTVTMYEHDNFLGTSWAISSDTPLFSALSPTANDKVTSVKVQ